LTNALQEFPLGFRRRSQAVVAGLVPALGIDGSTSPAEDCIAVDLKIGAGDTNYQVTLFVN